MLQTIRVAESGSSILRGPAVWNQTLPYLQGRSGGDAVEVALVCHIAVRTAADLIRCLSSHHGSKLFSLLAWHVLFILPECNVYVDQLHFCTREMDPICATNGRTYPNKCVFCSEKLKDSGKFDFSHWGCC
ncbi:uncharacterized protein [Globicephala melas]|uniref:uncharacterized protein isoform X1 n=1 Tax=Globicephala melas TaxID=9731 RepID=UPI00293D7692|nr:double-headed protease inhibitor, submandibular gland-like isoform X1 [Globicephala melas]